MSDRRFGDRETFNDLIIVTGGDPPATLNARLLNASPGGLGVQAERPLPIFARVLVTHSGSQQAGHVRYCSRDDQGLYKIGIKFES